MNRREFLKTSLTATAILSGSASLGGILVHAANPKGPVLNFNSQMPHCPILFPALYREERRVFGWWILFASSLFFGGVVFCGGGDSSGADGTCPTGSPHRNFSRAEEAGVHQTAILIVAAILTPPDIVSQVMLAVPIWLLFELGLFLAAKIEFKQKEPPYEQT